MLERKEYSYPKYVLKIYISIINYILYTSIIRIAQSQGLSLPVKVD